MRDRGKKGGGCCSFFGFAVYPLLLCACCIWLCCPDKPHKNSGKRRRRLATTTTTPVCTVQYTVYVWRAQPIGSSLRGHRATLSYDLIWPPPPPRKTSFGDLSPSSRTERHTRRRRYCSPNANWEGGGGELVFQIDLPPPPKAPPPTLPLPISLRGGGPGSHFDVPSPRFPRFSFSPPEFIRIVEWGHTQAGGGGGGGGGK